MVPAFIRLRRGPPPRWSIPADIPQRSNLRRSRRICRALIPRISLACTQLSCLAIALVITARRVIAPASRPTRRSMSCIERLYRTRRTSLNVYAPDISNVYDNANPLHFHRPGFGLRWRLRPARYFMSKLSLWQLISGLGRKFVLFLCALGLGLV